MPCPHFQPTAARSPAEDSATTAWRDCVIPNEIAAGMPGTARAPWMTMVDSSKGKGMATPDDLEVRVERVEHKLDALASSVDEGFAEQRQYTEFAFDRLRSEMLARFGAVDARFDAVDARFDGMDARFDRMDDRFDRMDARFDAMDSWFDTVDSRFNRLERKVDYIIDRLIPPDR